MGDTTKLYVGKGIVSYKGDGDVDYVEMGNAPSVALQLSQETLDHYSSQEGIKQKDKTVTISQSGTLTLTLEEITARNLRLAMMGDSETDSDGNTIINVGTQSSVEGWIRFRGTNSVGLQLNYDAKVSIRPSDPFNFVGDDWGQLSLTAEVLATDGALGQITVEDVEPVA